MSNLNDVLDKPPEVAPAHPRLRYWATLINQGATAVVEVFRSSTTLGAGQSEMELLFTKKDNTPLMESFPFDDVFNAGLIELHVRAVDPANESERFALGLRAALRKAERDFGDGYFNSVLFEFVTESDLTLYPDIAEIMKHAYALKPNHGKGYNDCRDMIADAVGGRKFELEKSLGYDSAEAKEILVNALAKYLDERFSVSGRRLLGLL
jgi:hypothetical protein